MIKKRDQKEEHLKCSISLPFLVFYGLGTIIGGGIYALMGKVAGVAGMYAPLSFALSAFLALITAFSYAEMAVRYPLSAGEVRYVNAAFSWKNFSTLIGWLVVFTGIVSSAALATATAGFIQDFVALPTPLLTAIIIFILGFVAIWGITESVVLVTLITLIELGGLLLVIFFGMDKLAELDTRWPELLPPIGFNNFAIWSGILGGTFLAFYAFIGFEDMVNIAEEVKDVRRTMPWAILICIFITLIVYVLVAIVAVLTISPDILAESNTPLAAIIEQNGQAVPPSLMALISMLATINGVLVQMVMGSRVLYGMAKGGEAPTFLNWVHPKTQTPLFATVLVIVAVFILTLLSDLTTLAKATSAIILFVFASVNAALLKLKWAGKTKSTFTVPFWVPLLGTLICGALLTFELWKTFISFS